LAELLDRTTQLLDLLDLLDRVLAGVTLVRLEPVDRPISTA
jgi:hypothetical protein